MPALVPKLRTRTSKIGRNNFGTPHRPKYGTGKVLTYPHSTKLFLKKNPGVIKDFLRAIRDMRQFRSLTWNSDKINVQEFHAGGNIHIATYKVEINGSTFFIKENQSRHQPRIFEPRFDLAHRQIRALQKAKKALGKKFPNVIVADYHLAYTSNKRSFLVTDFYEGELLMDIGASIGHYRMPADAQAAAERWREGDALIRKLGSTLSKVDIGDVREYNCMWCPKIEKWVLFDLVHGKGYRPEF